MTGSTGTKSAGLAARADFGLFAISACILTIEVLQTKIFAFSLDPMTIYLAIGLCMAGLGASATVLSVLPPLPSDRVLPVAAASALIGGLLVPPVHVLFAAGSPALARGEPVSFVVLTALMLPYLAFGVAVAVLLVERGGSIGRAYAMNLGGSGVGCLIVFPLLDQLGAERAVIAIAMVAVAAGAALAPLRPRWLAASAVALLVLGLTLPAAPELIEFAPEPGGQLVRLENRIAELKTRRPDARAELDHVFQRWDRTARIDIYRVDATMPELRASPTESYFFVQDASAGSILFDLAGDIERGRPFYEGTVYGAGYSFGNEKEEVLAIGLGGGPDILTALHFGAKRIVGVEINATTIDLVRNTFADMQGRPYDRPEVSILQMDGRTYLRSSSDAFDLIQMSGADTKSVLAAGSLSVNENYLYTREAMRELLGRLKPSGLLVLNRFGDADAHRLSSVAVAGLRDVGARQPHEHLVVIQQGHWRAVLVKRAPFEADELRELARWATGSRSRSLARQVRIPPYDGIGLPLGQPMELQFAPAPLDVATTDYFRALAAGHLDAYIAGHPRADFSAPIDDRPYFFFRQRPWSAFSEAVSGTGGEVLQRFHTLLGQIGLVAALFIFVPLVVMRSRGLETRGAGRTLSYFACLGGGFMLVEIGLIQRFVLLLGHQSYAVSVVLFGLMLGASLGSFASSRIPVTRRAPLAIALAALIVVVVLLAFGLRPVFDAAAGASFAARLALALSILVVLGFGLGLPFPTGLRAVRSGAPAFVAWAIGVNGFASVIGSTLAVEVSMLVGLRALLLSGAGLYLLAILLAPTGAARASAGP